MNLHKETLSYHGQINGYEKYYDIKGRLINEKKYSQGIGFNTNTKYIYNNVGKIGLEMINYLSDSGKQEIIIKHYTYSGDNNYRITHYISSNRNIFDDISINDEEHWNEVDEVIKIEEFKFKNSFLISEKSSDLKNNKGYLKEFQYDNYGNICELKKDGIVVFQKEYDNKENILHSIKEFKFYKDLKYLSFETKYYYDEFNQLTKREKYGRFNSKMYLFDVKYIRKQSGNKVKLYQTFYHFTEFLGYFDYESMLEINKGDFQMDFLIPDSFENREFDVNYAKKFDNYNNIIGLGRFYDNKFEDITYYEIYINEYTPERKLDFVLGLTIEDNNTFEKLFTKKFYYK